MPYPTEAFPPGSPRLCGGVPLTDAPLTVEERVSDWLAAPPAPEPATTCASCGAEREDGQRIRCRLCVRAAEIAVSEAGGQAVYPSDIARVRARLDIVETVGFTGTRHTSPELTEHIERIVGELPKGTRVVTGACLGVDALAATIAYQNGLTVHTIVPADRSRVDREWRAWCHTYEEMPAGTDYRARNERIVELSDRLIAIPEHPEAATESRRSGTWMTVRIGRRDGKPVDVRPMP